MAISDINVRVDRNLCYACGVCVETCIMDNLRLSLAPCRQACPLDMNCQGYIRLLAQGKEAEAARELRLSSPFGRLLGRLCTRPCESACERQALIQDGPVQIRALKRYLAEAQPAEAEAQPAPAPASGRKVGVVGSGPAGLMAAYELACQGHAVTVFEAADRPGGMLSQAIPASRLPLAEVDRVVEFLTRLGIEFQTGVTIGRDLALDQLRDRHDAVVLAIGAGRPREVALPGRELKGVVQALDLLRQVKAGGALPAGRSVVVIGGGNTAVDAALACRRRGVPEVRLVCLEGTREMPASAEELAEAREEGVVLHPGWGVAGLERTAEGRLRLELVRCLTVCDAAGRFAPVLEPGPAPARMEADLVVLAVGQAVDPGQLPAGLVDPATGLLRGDSLTRQVPGQTGLFACGDAHSGPSSVVAAMASAREAAISADRYLRGEALGHARNRRETLGQVTEYQSLAERAQGGRRGEPERTPVKERGPAVEIERVLSPEAAAREAARCLSCGRSFEQNQTCWYCLPCEIECPAQALEIRMPYLVR